MIPIDIKNLIKEFDGLQAVNNISFSVQRGETLALLGANGAGKTTTIAMMMGLLLPTKGTIHILGADITKNPQAILSRVNFSSPYVEMPRRLSVRQNLTFFANLFGIKDVRKRLTELQEELDLKAIWNKPAAQLSAGQKTRASLAKAFINKPLVLLLDEPTASLDPDTADWVRTYLETYQKQTGAAILLASHNMPEVERLAHRVLMMQGGGIVDEGTPKDLVRKYGRKNLEEVFLDIARGTNVQNTKPKDTTDQAEAFGEEETFPFGK